jgi:hypothetical protein
MSITRRSAWYGLSSSSAAPASMAPEIEVPPPRHRAGLQRRSGPLQHGHGDRLHRPGTDRGEHARMAERGRITLLLQFEPVVADAAGSVDR